MIHKPDSGQIGSTLPINLIRDPHVRRYKISRFHCLSPLFASLSLHLFLLHLVKSLLSPTQHSFSFRAVKQHFISFQHSPQRASHLTFILWVSSPPKDLAYSSAGIWWARQWKTLRVPVLWKYQSRRWGHGRMISRRHGWIPIPKDL